MCIRDRAVGVLRCSRMAVRALRRRGWCPGPVRGVLDGVGVVVPFPALLVLVLLGRQITGDQVHGLGADAQWLERGHHVAGGPALGLVHRLHDGRGELLRAHGGGGVGAEPQVLQRPGRRDGHGDVIVLGRHRRPGGGEVRLQFFRLLLEIGHPRGDVAEPLLRVDILHRIRAQWVHEASSASRSGRALSAGGQLGVATPPRSAWVCQGCRRWCGCGSGPPAEVDRSAPLVVQSRVLVPLPAEQT